MTDFLRMAFPGLATRLGRLPLATLPTPLETGSNRVAGGHRAPLLIKRDDVTGETYGGNKVRKLEYLLQRARDRGARRVATFGTVASNHALATAVYATAEGFGCTAFLSHQARTPKAPVVLNLHQQLGTNIVRFGGTRTQRIATLREHLGNRDTWVIPMGGSSWLGVVGFVAAGLELAEQLETTGIPAPARVYVANGTMGTAAGLAIGFALADLATELHAVRVTHESIANAAAMHRLIAKTTAILHTLDPAVAPDLGASVRLVLRDEFFAGGYARSDDATDRAVATAAAELGLTLETTYTGKAMAALLADLEAGPRPDARYLFWNTFNSRPLPAAPATPTDTANLPEEFLRYFEAGGAS